MYIVTVFLFLLYCKDIYNFETILSGKDYLYDDTRCMSDSTYSYTSPSAFGLQHSRKQIKKCMVIPPQIILGELRSK
jgi:hypothetical protein